MKRALYRSDAGEVADLAGNEVFGVPDPSGEPDGETLQTSSGAAVWAADPGGAVDSVFGRTGAVLAVTGDYYGAVAAALTGATQASRYVGATTSGSPVSGTFVKGDWAVAQDGHIFVCTTGGTPGTWQDIGGGGGVTYGTPAIVLGTAAANGSVDEAIRRDSTIIAFDATVPTTQAFGDSAATGAAAVAARRDHKHAMPAAPTYTSVGADAAGAAAAAQAASQPLDADLTALGGLDSSTSGAIASDGAGWIKKTYSQFKTALGLVKADVGLGSVDNTADSAKNVATAAALTTARAIDGQNFDGTAAITVIAPGTHAATSKTTPVDADELPLVDSAASNVLKKLTWANLKATIKAYTDTLYPSGSGTAYVVGGTDVAVADGGTGASVAATARSNLGIPAAVGGIEWTVVTKALDESVTSSTVLQADDELLFTAVSGAVYELQVFLVYASPLGAGTPDMKVGCGEDATIRGGLLSLSGLNAADNGLVNSAILSNQSSIGTYGTAAANRGIILAGEITGNGGTFGIYWAQNVSGGNATTVRAGSVLRYRRIV